MAAGQSDKLKIGAIIQARMKSERLPGKILMPLPFPMGRPLLSWIIESVRRSRSIDKIILASSDSKENDPLEIFCAENAVPLFRGSEQDVLSRFIKLVRENNFDVVVRLTGDNPVIDLPVLEEVIAKHVANKNDYTITSGLPVGMNIEVVSGRALLSLEKEALSPDDREHVTLHIRNNHRYRTQVIDFGKNENLQKLRLTVDYPSDFSALSLILSFLQPGEFPGIDFIDRLSSEHAWLFTCNIDNVQRNQVKRN